MLQLLHSALGEDARKTLKEMQQKLTQAKVNLGKQYSELVTGQGHVSMHHSCQGRYVSIEIQISAKWRDYYLCWITASGHRKVTRINICMRCIESYLFLIPTKFD